MKEIHEFRIFKDRYHLLPTPNDANFNGMVYVLKVSKDDPLFERIGEIDNAVLKKSNEHLFGFWDVNRKYSKKELSEASLFQFSIKSAFEPTGEECGTEYDESVACELCGTGRKQIGNLKLRKGSIPKKDIARTIAGEVVVSSKLATAFRKRELKGASFEPIDFGKGQSKYFQLIASSPELEIATDVVVGHNPFNLSTEDSEATQFTVSGGYTVKLDREVYKCPKGHLIGPRLLSEAYINKPSFTMHYDFFVSKQKIGTKQGLLRPEPLYLCSPNFRKMVLEEKLKGFEFEIAHVE